MNDLNRREFLLAGVAATAAACLPQAAQGAGAAHGLPAQELLSTITRGFLTNARKTSPNLALCDYSEGTKLPSCMAPSEHTYVSVARMLPALASAVASDHAFLQESAALERAHLLGVLKQIFQHASDPSDPDYWGEARTDKADQRQVEASLVAWSLWLLGSSFISQLRSEDRTNIQNWLAGCTRVAERKHNHAWFSALNQAVRLDLSRQFKEFSGDEEWMLADLQALDSMAVADGWYNDYPDMQVFDYYNFWTYASHFLLWNEVIGARYPELRDKFAGRLRSFLEKTPCFFGANGSHVLFGRSLIYRWAVLTPLVLAYRQKLWPHSPGLLRRIIRRNLEFHAGLKPYDRKLGKLRETYSQSGTADVRENYVDNGHPYWCMQAFTMFLIPEKDPLFHAKEELLPIERADFRIDYPRLGMGLSGCAKSGQVQWFQTRNVHKATYRDKYIKFAYSSHFPFNAVAAKDKCPWDSTLVFRDPLTGETSGRGAVHCGELRDGRFISWWTSRLGDMCFEVESCVEVDGEFQLRTHRIVAPTEAVLSGIEILEGSYPLGLEGDETAQKKSGHGFLMQRSRNSGYVVASWSGNGYGDPEPAQGLEKANLIYARNAVNTLRAVITMPGLELSSVHYASPRPLGMAALQQKARELLSRSD